MDSVSAVLPGGASGPAPAVDADGPVPQGVFPAALVLALAQPGQASTGRTPPVDAGQVLPVQAMKAGVEPGLIALPVTAGALDPLAPEAGHASAAGVVAPAPTAVVDALDDIATGQNAGVAAAVQAPAAGGAPVRASVGNSPAAGAGVTKAAVVVPAPTAVVDALDDIATGHNAGVAAAAQAPAAGGAAVRASVGNSPTAVAGVIQANVAPSSRAHGKPAQQDADASVLAPAESTGASPPPVVLALPATVMETTATGRGAEGGTPAQVAGNARKGTALPLTVERPAVSVVVPAASGGGEAALVAQATSSPDPGVPSAAVPGSELAALVSSAPRMATPNGTPSLELPLAATPGSPEFSHELGERLLWLVREGVHEARLQLNPRELGPIEVRLGVSDGAAQVSFSAQHAGTAAAVQHSLPQLREMLAQQGLQLGQAEVSQQQPGTGQQTPQQERSAAGDARGPAGRGVDEPFAGERVRVIGRGLVDAYA